jgi:hypothetical protein
VTGNLDAGSRQLLERLRDLLVLLGLEKGHDDTIVYLLVQKIILQGKSADLLESSQIVALECSKGCFDQLRLESPSRLLG